MRRPVRSARRRPFAPIIALLAVIAAAAIYFVVRDVQDRLAQHEADMREFWHTGQMPDPRRR